MFVFNEKELVMTKKEVRELKNRLSEIGDKAAAAGAFNVSGPIAKITSELTSLYLQPGCIAGADVITHGDGDGIIAAAIVIKAGATGNLVITQQRALPKFPDLVRPTVVLDMAMDKDNVEGFLNWVRRNQNRIALWVDHHQGSEALAEILGDRFVYNPQAPSCPQILRDMDTIFAMDPNWLEAANACDRPAQYPATDLSQRYNAAFKVALISLQSNAPDAKGAVEKVQRGYIDELLSGKENEFVSQHVVAYPVLMKSTEFAAQEYRQVEPGVVATSVDHQTSVDITVLLIAGYKLAPVAVVQTASAEDGSPITIVATNDKNRNLVTALGLISGSSQRVVLVGGTHEEQLERVRTTLG